ncbi:MAG: hypothetical protein ACR2LD_07585 [Actinomycetota bacterium]
MLVTLFGSEPSPFFPVSIIWGDSTGASMPFEHSAESFAVPIGILAAIDERFGRDG